MRKKDGETYRMVIFHLERDPNVMSKMTLESFKTVEQSLNDEKEELQTETAGTPLVNCRESVLIARKRVTFGFSAMIGWIIPL